MINKMQYPEVKQENTLVFERRFKAPIDLVFDAWTTLEHLEKWWGPTGFSTTTQLCEIRTGGSWIFTMHGPDGKDYPNKVHFDLVERPHTIQYHHRGDGETGDVQFHVTVQLKERNDNTELVMTMVFPSAEILERVAREYGAIEGGRQTLARLEQLLAEQVNGENTLILTRHFAVSREQVWKAWTDPDHLKRWWGPKDFTAPHISVDLREGGTYLFCMRSEQGRDFWSGGTYLTIREPEILEFTDHFADENGNMVHASAYGFEGVWPHEFIVRVFLEDLLGETKMTLMHAAFPTKQLAEKTKAGWNASFDKMETDLTPKD